MDFDFGGDFPIDNAQEEEPPILPLQPIISPTDLLLLQNQADESARYEQALNVALLNAQILTDERDAAVNRAAESHRLMQETRTSLEAQTQHSTTMANQLELSHSLTLTQICVRVRG